MEIKRKENEAEKGNENKMKKAEEGRVVDE